MDRVFFLHVPKTGGSSLSAALGKKFAAWEIFPWHHRHLDLFDPTELMPFRFFHGHYNIADLDYVPKPSRAITLLREPRKRIVSLYNFWRSHKPDAFPKYEPHHPPLTRMVGLSGFLRLPNPSMRVAFDNAQVQAYLPYPLRGRNGALTASKETIVDDALQALDDMAAFGALERFDDSLRVISAELGTSLIPSAEPVRSFESLATSGRHEPFEREERNSEINELLDAHTELDRQFYQKALKLFDSKFARYLGAPETAANPTSANDRTVTHVWGDWINFGSNFHIDGVAMDGWSAREEWGIWSIGERSTLRIGRLPKPAGTIRLTVAVRPAVFLAHPTQTITVLINGHTVDAWEFVFDPDVQRSAKILNLPATAVDGDGTLELTFAVRHPVVPAAAGISNDTRELGLGLQSIQLDCLG